MIWTYLRYPPLVPPPPEPPAQGSLDSSRPGLEGSPYRAPPSPTNERAVDPDEEDEASARRTIVAAILFILLCALLRLSDPLFGSEEFDLDFWLALIAATISGVYLGKLVIVWCRRRLGSS